MRRGAEAWLVRAVAAVVALIFLYPFYWMLVASFRSQAAILSAPLRLWPERLDLSGFTALGTIGGVSFWNYALNSLLITGAATALGVFITGLGAYALYRGTGSCLLALVRYAFMIKIMYPSLLLVMPLYIVVFRLGLLGTTAGLVLCSIPLVFFLFAEFFRSVPIEMIEAARIDGASEWQILILIVTPLARPVVLAGVLISFLLTWKEWFAVMVLSTGPQTYTLQLALVSLNSEFGVNYQAIMALGVVTVLPVALVFLLTQRWVMQGFMAGGVKG